MQTGRAVPSIDSSEPGGRRGRANLAGLASGWTGLPPATPRAGGDHALAAARMHGRRSALWATLVAGALGVLVAGCGLSPAGLLGAGAHQQQELAYSACIRSHGIPDFPDPRGGIQENGTLTTTTVNGVTLKESQAQIQTAEQACQQYQEAHAGDGPASPQQQQAALAYAQCMRTHGITNFPDPKVTAHSFAVHVPSGTDPNSPQFQAATSACQSLMPGDRAAKGGKG